MPLDRRQFFTAASGLVAGARLANHANAQENFKIEVDLPRGRVPLSFIIDDSTCLVNMGKFCMPQFQATYPTRADYQKPWRDWPDEIPDQFVRDFGQWCAMQGVRGKYSIVPFPACVGWLDRTLPGWSHRELQDSLKLVRELMVPNWDIHPEMISHTRVIDLKTGRPFEDFSPANMENSYPQQDMSVDHLAAYLAYALQILKNCDLPCDGITTPGGFGNRVKSLLPVAVFQAVRDVYGSELPHYFKYVVSDDSSNEPSFEAVRGEDTDGPEFTTNIPAGTGDWFGGWDGADTCRAERYANEDASVGRMVELIEQRRPAIMLCHWAGLYGNGSEQGFRDFQRVVLSLEQRFKDETMWMKISEIGRYWAAKRFTKLSTEENSVKLSAPFACPNFTLRIEGRNFAAMSLANDDTSQKMNSVSSLPSLNRNRFYKQDGACWLCFDLPKGESRLQFA